jgi:hypothetical protein
MALATQSKIPLLAPYIARRAIAAKQLEPVAATLLSNTDLALRLQLLEGVRDGLKSLGRNAVTKPKNWDEALAAIDAAKDAKAAASSAAPWRASR